MALLMKPEPFSREVDRLFDTFFGGGEGGGRRWVPPMDLVDAGDHFVLKADLPGLSEADVAIEVGDGVLTISGERRAEHEDNEQGWYRVERSFESFARTLSLPEGADPEAVSAEFDRGVVEVRIPKPAQRKPRRVEIKANANGNGQPAVEGTAEEK